MFKLIGHIDEHYKDTFKQKGAEFNLIWLWNRLVDYGSYWQLNTPTVNGNPDFLQLKGWIDGYCASKGWEWEENDKEIKVYQNNKIILYMELNPKPQSYYNDLKDINETLTRLYGF